MASNDVEVDILLNTKQARASLDRLEKSFSDFSKTATKETKKATGAMEVFAGTLSADLVLGGMKAVGSAFIAMGADAIQSAAQIEGLKSQLTTLTGSAGDAGAILKDLQEFSASTPFQLPGLAESTKKLLSFGVAQEDIIGTLTELGDVAAGSGADLQDLTLIFGQIQAQGKLTGERFLQLQERAIPIGPAIAKTMNVSEKAVRGLITAGKVTAEQFNAAFASMSQSGGQFYEGMIRQSKTFDGVMSTLGDNIGLVSADIGDGLLPTAKTLGLAFISLIQNNQDLVKQLKEFLAVNLAGAVDGMVSSIVPLGKAVVFLNDVFRGLLSTYDAVMIGLNELVGGFIDGTRTILEGAAAAQKFLGMDTSGIDSIIETMGDMREAVSGTTSELVDGIGKRVKSQREFADTVEEVTTRVSGSLAKTIADERALTAATAEETEKRSVIKTESAERALTEKEQIDARVLELEQAKIDKTIEMKANEIAALNEMNMVESERKEEERLINLEMETGQADARLQGLVDVLGREEALRSEAEARRLEKEGKVSLAKKERMKANEKAEKESIWAIQAFEDKTQKEKLSSLKSSFGAVASLQSSNNKTLFAIGKAAAISNATIDGIAGVQKALGSAPPPFNFILAGLVGAAAAVNIGKIASSSPPSFAGGGVVPGTPSDKDNTMANVASGEVILNRRQQANTLFQIANGGGGAGGAGGPQINIQIEAGVGGISTEQVDLLIDSINDRVEFGNQSIQTGAA